MNIFKKKHPKVSSLILTANSKMGHSRYDARRDAERLSIETGCDVRVPDRGVYVYYRGDGQTETVEFWPDENKAIFTI